MGSRAQLAFFPPHHPSFLLARESLLLKEKVPKNVKRPMQAREKKGNSKIPVLLLVKQVPWAVATNTIFLAKKLYRNVVTPISKVPETSWYPASIGMNHPGRGQRNRFSISYVDCFDASISSTQLTFCDLFA